MSLHLDMSTARGRTTGALAAAYFLYAGVETMMTGVILAQRIVTRDALRRDADRLARDVAHLEAQLRARTGQDTPADPA